MSMMRRKLDLRLGPTTVVILAAVLLTTSVIAQKPEQLDIYRSRRVAVGSRLSDGIVVLFGRTEAEGSEAYHVFRQEENFYYLSGEDEPGAILMLVPASGEENGQKRTGLGREILFLPKHDSEAERWTGPKPDPLNPATASQTGFAEVKAIQEFPELLRQLSQQYDAIYTLLPSPHAGSGGSEKDNLDKLHTLLP